MHVHACVYQYACFYVYLSECACVHERVLENVCVCVRAKPESVYVLVHLRV